MNRVTIREQLVRFYKEDVGTGDFSVESIFPEEMTGELTLIAKDTGIFCGKMVIEEGFKIEGTNVTIEYCRNDGEKITAGETVATIQGPIRTLLTCERLVLNLIQRMSAIATKTNHLVQLMGETDTRLTDTRKTAPGLRMFDKYAVKVGGGHNHRFGLYDAIMLKDNHIAFSGSITEAVNKARDYVGHTVPIEVEIETEAQLDEAVQAEPNIIMFDNCTPEQIAKWLPKVPKSIATEASGMITEETIRAYSETGVDYISVGALTHSVQVFDMSAVVKMKTMEETS